MKIVRLILLIIHLGLLVSLVAVLLNAYIPPKIFPWFNFFPLGFPIMIISYIILTFFWIFSWKKRAFLFMFLGLFFINPVKRWVNYSDKKSEESNFKILTYNIKGAQLGKESIEEYINQENPDLLFLQENGYHNFNFNLLSGKNNHPVVSLYSKHKILSYKNLFENHPEWDITAQCEQIDLEINGKTYRVFNVHLESFGVVKDMVKLNGDTKEDEKKLKDLVKRLVPTFKQHQEQVRIIRENMDASPYPVIVAGDFNSVPNSYEYYQISKNLKDAFFEVGNGSGTSFHDYKYPLRIDYIFTSDVIDPVSYKVDRSTNLSDHFPVIATFKIN